MYWHKIFLFLLFVSLALISSQLYPILHPVLAEHPINVDQPGCPTINPPAGNYTEGTTIPLVVTATDTSGISSMEVSLVPSGGSAIVLPTADIPSAGTSSTATSKTQSYSWTPTANTYSLKVSIINNAGNIKPLTECVTTFVINSAIGAWIQAVGDVHSNTSINASGGP